MQVQRDIANLVIGQPFFASILLRMDIVETDEPTMSTNGRELRYNRTWWEKQPRLERHFILMHEALHVALLHHMRGKGKIHKNWNIACDYVINAILHRNGNRLFSVKPDNALFRDIEDASKTAEEVYTELIQNDSEGEGEPEPEWGEVEQADPAGADDDKQNDLIQIQQLINTAKAQGDLPSYVEEAFTQFVSEKADWQSILSRWVEEVANADYTFMRPNSRFAHTGIGMPTLYSEAYGGIAIAVDTSGSMSQEELQLAVGEVINASKTYEDNSQEINCRIIYFDAIVHSVDTIEDAEDVPPPVGRGGTDFRAPMKCINEMDDQPKGNVIITDGWCNSFGDEPEGDVLWMITSRGDKNFSPPFGEVIHLA